MSEPLFYANGPRIYQRPSDTILPDGRRATSMGFCVCEMFIGMEEQATTLARILNRGSDAKSLLAAMDKALAYFGRTGVAVELKGSFAATANHDDNTIQVSATIPIDELASMMEAAEAVRRHAD